MRTNTNNKRGVLGWERFYGFLVLSLLLSMPAVAQTTCVWQGPYTDVPPPLVTSTTGAAITQAQFDALVPVADVYTNCGSYIEKVVTSYSLGAVVTAYQAVIPSMYYMNSGSIRMMLGNGGGGWVEPYWITYNVTGPIPLSDTSAVATAVAEVSAAASLNHSGTPYDYVFDYVSGGAVYFKGTGAGAGLVGYYVFTLGWSAGQDEIPQTNALITSTTTILFPANTYTGNPKDAGKPICEQAQGNPINAGTGNKVQQEVDYAGAGLFPLQLTRTYNSQITNGIGFGVGQRSNYGGRVLTPNASTAWLTRPDGKQYTYTLTGGIWISDADVTDKLVQLIDAKSQPTGWTYSQPDGTIENYDATGMLSSITKPMGLTQTLTYSCTAVSTNCPIATPANVAPVAGLLITVTDSYGRSLNFTYDSASHVSTLTDPAGGTYTYAYDTNSNLISVTYPDSKMRRYVYENSSYPRLLTGIIDEDGNRYATWNYDATGNAISSEHGVGVEKVTLTYGTGSTAITDALGTVRTQTYQVVQGVVKSGGMSQPGGSGCAAASNNLTYDANGNIATRTDFDGNLTTYAYDLTRNLETSRTEGLTSSGAKTPATRTTNTTWHSTYRLPLTLTEQDTSGTSAVTLRTTTLNYDATGNLLTKTVTDAQTPAATRTWTYTYNPQGQPLTVDGPRTDVNDLTTYTYNNGNLNTITNALQQTTTLSNYNAHGQPQLITDPNGLTTTLSYDSRQRLISQNTNGRITAYDYHPTGQLKKVTEPAGNTLTYTYDDAHRLTDITDNLGNKIHYTPDLMGNRTREEIRDPANTLLRTHNRVYDALNRLQQEYGVTTQLNYEYDAQGNLQKVTDALNQTTRYEYDALNRQTKRTDPLISGAPTGYTGYTYNALDQLTQVTDPNSVATQYTLNALGDLKQQTSKDSGITQNGYDAAGNLTSRTDAKNQIAGYTYDALNRLTRATYPATSDSPALQIDYQYDTGTNAIGKLTQVTEKENSVTVVTTNYTYTTFGQLDSVIRTLGTVNSTTRYRYDPSGRLIGLNYPSGRTVDYTLDGVGRINQITTTQNNITQTVVSAISYLGFDQTPSNYTLGNGRVVNRTTDLEGKLSSYTLSGNVQSLGYNNAGQIISRSNSANPLNDTSSYAYDALNRLISDNLPGTTQSYQYDANGNRTTRLIGTASESYAYNPATSGNRLNSVTLSGNLRSLTYDANGSVTADNAIQYAYDARNRKVQAIANGTTTQYKYDAFGQRIQKSDPQKQTLFTYDQNGKLISESDGQGTPQRDYIYLGDKPVAVWE